MTQPQYKCSRHHCDRFCLLIEFGEEHMPRKEKNYCPLGKVDTAL